MTTKEEVLQLAKDAGFQQVTFNPSGFTGIFACVAGQNLEPEITKLIELAKAQEREACAKLLEQPITHLNPTECCADKVVQTLRWNFQNLAKAIRNRERKE